MGKLKEESKHQIIRTIVQDQEDWLPENFTETDEFATKCRYQIHAI